MTMGITMRKSSPMDISIEGETKARRVEKGPRVFHAAYKQAFMDVGKGETIIIAIIIYLCSPDTDIPSSPPPLPSPPPSLFNARRYALKDSKNYLPSESKSIWIRLIYWGVTFRSRWHNQPSNLDFRKVCSIQFELGFQSYVLSSPSFMRGDVRWKIRIFISNRINLDWADFMRRFVSNLLTKSISSSMLKKTYLNLI